MQADNTTESDEHKGKLPSVVAVSDCCPMQAPSACLLEEKSLPNLEKQLDDLADKATSRLKQQVWLFDLVPAVCLQPTKIMIYAN